MPDPVPTAAVKVLAALAALSVPTVGTNKFIFRSVDEAIEAGDIPAMILSIGDVAYSYNQDMTLHTARVQVEFIAANTATRQGDRFNEQAMAEFIEAIQADRTLGGRLIDIEEKSSSVDPDGVDVRSTLLLLRAEYFTPRGDFHTIAGQGGLTF